MSFKIPKKLKPYHLVALLALGIMLMIFSNRLSSKPAEEASQIKIVESNTDENHMNIEKNLANIIEKIDGVGNCDVFITFENSGVKKLATNIKDDTTNSDDALSTKRDVTAVMEKKSGTESPYVSEETMPQIRGVLIVAKGVDKIKIKEEIALAISSVLGVSLHKVKILPAK